MTTRTETTNGVTRYFVNEKMYERLEDVPEEFRKHFLDQNNFGHIWYVHNTTTKSKTTGIYVRIA